MIICVILLIIAVILLIVLEINEREGYYGGYYDRER